MTRFGQTNGGNIIAGGGPPTEEERQRAVAIARSQLVARLERSKDGLRKNHGMNRNRRRHYWKMIQMFKRTIRNVIAGGHASFQVLEFLNSIGAFMGYLPSTKNPTWADPS